MKPFLDEIARERCAKILASEAARAVPKEAAQALVTISFVYGAAWALDQPDMIEAATREVSQRRAQVQHRIRITSKEGAMLYDGALSGVNVYIYESVLRTEG